MADARETVDLTNFQGSIYSIGHFGITLILDVEDLLKYVVESKTGKEPDKATKEADWEAWKRAAVIIYKSCRPYKLHQSQAGVGKISIVVR